jgi:hypothetical protein
MSQPPEQYPFVVVNPVAGAASAMPYLPLSLSLGTTQLPVSGLLDTGAAINVLPHSVGLQLGADWGRQTTTVQLSGNMAGIEARVLVVSAAVGKFAPARLAFAWARVDGPPVILGQMNFFLEFDVCFYRSRSVFDIRPK